MTCPGSRCHLLLREVLFQQKMPGHLDNIQINLQTAQYLMQTVSHWRTKEVTSGEPTTGSVYTGDFNGEIKPFNEKLLHTTLSDSHHSWPPRSHTLPYHKTLQWKQSLETTPIRCLLEQDLSHPSRVETCADAHP